MTPNYKRKYDIFICGGSEHFGMLRELLPRLYPFGAINLASVTLSDSELEKLSPYVDAIHKPLHDPRGYLNFNLFCIRDINRLAKAPFFIKLDADVELRDGWIDYVERGIAAHGDAVLFGVKEGIARINIRLSGPLVQERLGRDVLVEDGRKVIGGFYVASTPFFKRHDRFMQTVHEFLYLGEGGAPGAFELEGDYHDLRRIGNEDTLRSLVVHALGAGDRMFVLDSEGMIFVPHGPGLDRRGGRRLRGRRADER
ncbi:MAG TPA: hypothetical protein VE262_16470 [Blastocatellia bacterium]|nr:hypothetical protein [Blastocatellia bacterium]